MKTALITDTSVWMRNRLTGLQVECLPGDLPLDPFEGEWFGLWQGKELIGFASLTPEADGVGYLSRAGVKPSFRGKGGQRMLIKVREKRARELGLTWLTSDTYNNPASANNLIACGFRMYHPSFPTDGVCYWRKCLA